MNFYTLQIVYVVMAAVIVALGIMNTSISSACSTLADASQIGGLFGILEAVESLAGLVGPAIGGILYRKILRFFNITIISGLIKEFIFINRNWSERSFGQV